MPKNVMKLLKPSRNVGKNAFDLSHRHLMTANFGELLPITCIETVPGDYITMKVSDLLRAMPMVTSPFMRVKQHIDVWFTPYNDLWHNFEQFITMKEQPVSSALFGSAYCPHAYLSDLWDLSDVVAQDVIGHTFSTGAHKLLDYLGYGRKRNYTDFTKLDTTPCVNIWRLLQYNKIWYDEYRQQYYDDGTHNLASGLSPAQLFNVDDLECDSVAHANIRSRTNYTSSLGAMLQMRYRCWKKDLYTGVLPSTQFGNVSGVPVSGHDLFTLDGSVTGSDAGRWFFSNDSPLDTDGENVVTKAGSNPGGSLRDADATRNIKHTHKLLDDNLSIGYYENSMMINILTLRKSEAIQIWRENAMRAGNRISDNLRAHYGDDSEYNDHRSVLIGSVDAPLNIGDIDSHAQIGSSANQQLADVAGKGLSSLNEDVFRFKAKKFGCIMVMFSLIPEAEYQSDGIDRMNQLIEMEDYFQSEYQNTGLEAISSQTFLAADVADAITLGYGPAYVGYKQKLDKCFNTYKLNEYNASWASPKTDIYSFLSSQTPSLALASLYINPSLYNRNFGVAVTGDPNAEAGVEQVLCDFFFNVDAVRAMSVIGLPQNV